MTSRAAAVARGSGAFVLVALTINYALNFLDRQLLSILAIPVKADLGLTDFELGLLGGPAFALLYSFAGVPVAWLADRRGRSRIIVIALGVWSAFTALCGLASGFWQLFAFRLGVGVGEAGGAAPALALIAERFPPERRGRAVGLFVIGAPIGAAMGMILGGVLSTYVNWRVAFLAAGAAGILFLPILTLAVRRTDSPLRSERTGPSPPASFWQSLASIVKVPSFWLLSIGGSLNTLVGFGIAFWLPSLLRRDFGLSLIGISLFYAALLIIGGFIGIVGGGMLVDRLGRAHRRAYAFVPAAAAALALPFYAAGIWINSLPLAFIVLVIPTALAQAGIAPVVLAVQQTAPKSARSTATAGFLFVNSLIGNGMGSAVVGAMSDFLLVRMGDGALRWAILATLLLYIPASLFLLLAARSLRHDWREGDHHPHY